MIFVLAWLRLRIRWEPKQTNTGGLFPMLLGIGYISSCSPLGWNRWSRKLMKIWVLVWPYHITKIISHMAYQLDLPSGSKIHPDYHTKGQWQSSTIAQYVVRRLEITNGAQRSQSNRLGMLKVLIQWNDLPDFEATWKSSDAIGQLFPLFHLEDKMKLLGGVLLVDLILTMFH